MRQFESSLFRAVGFALGCVIVGLVLLGPSDRIANSARGDEESPALVKYNVPVDESVERALEYLASQQRDDNLFPGQYGDTTAVPALVGMAFLSKGHSPGLGPYGETINRCIDLVLASEQQRDGKPSGYLVRTGAGKMYAHCISTLFLSEVSGMVEPDRQAKIDEVLPRALQLIVDAQAVQKQEQFQGGWRYEPTSNDADLSLTGWAVMALRSARLNGRKSRTQRYAKRSSSYCDASHRTRTVSEALAINRISPTTRR
ncbi:MAG: hypothetical protein R3B96_05840 [Pirellulaceae bacterium]